MATMYICNVCAKEDTDVMEFKIKVLKSNDELIREINLCSSCYEKLGKLIPLKTTKKEEKEAHKIDLIEDVFKPVLGNVRENKEGLKERQKKSQHGFEDWPTYQLMEALNNSNLNPQACRRGPDITFFNGTKLELKAASDFRLNWIIKEGAIKHNAPVLFLCNGTDKNKIEQLKVRPEVKVLAYEYLNDGEDDWIFGLIDLA